jgi:hypothetical protein
MSHHRRHLADAGAYLPDPHRTATGLGWFSIALGAAQLLAPHLISRPLGMHGSETLIRGYGAREILSGIGILTSRDPSPWLWGRVAGDALDMATLATRLGEDNPNRQSAAWALAAVAGVAVLDIYAAGTIGGNGVAAGPGYGGIDADGEWDWEPAVEAEGRRAGEGDEVWDRYDAPVT